jgi:hypothetical protein
MSAHFETLHDAIAAHPVSSAEAAVSNRKNSYSRRRWNAFDTWQDHVRRSAASVGLAFAERHDRDLRRAVVGG